MLFYRCKTQPVGDTGSIKLIQSLNQNTEFIEEPLNNIGIMYTINNVHMNCCNNYVSTILTGLCNLATAQCVMAPKTFLVNIYWLKFGEGHSNFDHN